MSRNALVATLISFVRKENLVFIQLCASCSLNPSNDHFKCRFHLMIQRIYRIFKCTASDHFVSISSFKQKILQFALYHIVK